MSCSDYDVNAAIAALALPVSLSYEHMMTVPFMTAESTELLTDKDSIKAHDCLVQTLATLAADPIASLVDTAYLGRYGAPCRHADGFNYYFARLTQR